MVKVDTGFTNIDGDVVDSLVPTFDYDVLPKAKETKGQEVKDLDCFEKAWRDCGQEVLDDSPFLTRSAWADWLFKHKISKTENAANGAVKASGKGLANRLLDSGKIADIGTGYVMSDPAFSTKLMLTKDR